MPPAVKIDWKLYGLASKADVSNAVITNHLTSAQKFLLQSSRVAAKTVALAARRRFVPGMKKNVFNVVPANSQNWVAMKKAQGFHQGLLQMTRTYLNSWNVRNVTTQYRGIYSQIVVAYGILPLGLATTSKITSGRIDVSIGPMTNQEKGMIFEGLIKAPVTPRPHVVKRPDIWNGIVIPMIQYVFPQAIRYVLLKLKQGKAFGFSERNLASNLLGVVP